MSNDIVRRAKSKVISVSNKVLGEDLTKKILPNSHGNIEKELIKERLDLLEKSRWIVPLGAEGYDLRFRVRSKTELKRITKFKEHWTLDWISQLPAGSVLWDVGANIGIMTTVAAQRKEIERVVSIEPFFLNYSVIVENLMLNQLSHKAVVVCGGLGEKTAFIPLKLQNLVEGGALHSFGEIYDMPDRSNEAVAEQACLSFRVDDLVKYEGIPFPTHLKIDIDGYELSMLKGAGETLADSRLIGIQVETMDQDPGLPQRKAVTSLLEGHGFRLDDEVAHGSQKTSVFDLRFVRQ